MIITLRLARRSSSPDAPCTKAGLYSEIEGSTLFNRHRPKKGLEPPEFVGPGDLGTFLPLLMVGLFRQLGDLL